MRKRITIQFESYQEMTDYGEEIIEHKETDYGIEAIVEIEEIPSITKERNCLIYTSDLNNGLYYGKKTATFRKSEAKIFTESEAKNKVYFLNKKSGYVWKYIYC